MVVILRVADAVLNGAFSNLSDFQNEVPSDNRLQSCNIAEAEGSFSSSHRFQGRREPFIDVMLLGEDDHVDRVQRQLGELLDGEFADPREAPHR